MNDLRLAFRKLLQHPGFAAVAGLTLALCLGANLAIFALIDAVVLRPLPFPAADRLVTMYNSYPKAGVDRDGSSLPNYFDRRGKIPAFASLSALRYRTSVVGEAGVSERLETLRVTPEFFATLGVGPALGRAFTEEELAPGNADVVILTDAYWRQFLHADPSVLGQRIRVDGRPKTVVGVLPAGFRFLSSKALLFFPLASEAEDRAPSQRHAGIGLEIVARLQPGATLAEAQAQVAALNAALERENPEAKAMADAGFHTPVVGLHADHVQAVRPVLLLLQGGVLFLLLIGGVNLVNLLLVRASGRARDLSIRQALGATRRHVLRQVMVETGLLALLGGLLGVGLGAAGLRGLQALGVDQLPLGTAVSLDGRVMLAALAGVVLMGVLLGWPVAWFTLRGHSAGALGSGSRGGTGAPAAQRLRHAFVVGQVALAFVLLAGAGLLGLSLRRVMEVAPGFRPASVLAAQVSLPGKNYPDDAARVGFTRRLAGEIARQPGVSAVGVATNLPLSGPKGKSAFSVRGYVLRPGESLRGHYNYGVGGDYFAALGIPLREGRLLDDADSEREARVCVVDEDFARHYWPRGSALGQQLTPGSEAPSDATAFTIVGVVGAVKQAGLTEAAGQGAVYMPYRYRAEGEFFVVTRASQGAESLAAILRRAVRALDAELPVNDLRSMDTRLADSLLAQRSPMLLAGVFAGVALLLAALGTYGVLSFAVAQRRREIGIRMAVGARPGQIGSQFLSLGTRLLAAGLVLGVLGAVAAGRLIQNVLFEVTALDPMMLTATAGVLGIISLAACIIPVRRAIQVEPRVAFEAE